MEYIIHSSVPTHLGQHVIFFAKNNMASESNTRVNHSL